MKIDLAREVELGAGVSAKYEKGVLTVKGPKGEVARELVHPKIKITIEAGKIVLKSPKATKKEKTMLGSFKAHLINTVRGVTEGHSYTLKICSGHFPMTVTVTGKDFVIKNFLGETVPRKVAIVKGVDVKITGNDIVITSADIEAAGLMASQIEGMCRITNRDRRIFQDGCYITKKSGKD